MNGEREECSEQLCVQACSEQLQFHPIGNGKGAEGFELEGDTRVFTNE